MATAKTARDFFVKDFKWDSRKEKIRCRAVDGPASERSATPTGHVIT
jgi:hypothetical protein